ncbi:TetR family transcriptional regulator [Kaistia sp. 32K]|uniref:TetR family transcriptional regulator n=1 Tax=Kaistia sp. 32K TaxID=2795690 RepID=UPI001FD6245A|nr:TetR family transcriptional regulator [Kaistia sp. 32K]
MFLDIGVSRASLDRIATEAGVTRGAIYWHFANKQELLTAICARVYDLHDGVVTRSCGEGGDPLQRLLDWGLEVIELFVRDEHTRQVYKIVVTRCEYTGEMQEALRLQQTMHDTMVANFRCAFEAVEAAGQLAEGWTAESASTTLKCFMSGMLDNWLRYDFDADVAKTYRACLRGLVESFRSKDDAPIAPGTALKGGMVSA